MNCEHWPSTKALSVYNVLVVAKSNALPLTHVIAFMQKNHLPTYDAEDVAAGVAFLEQRGLARSDGTILSATHSAGPHKPIRLKRVPGTAPDGTTHEDADLALDP